MLDVSIAFPLFLLNLCLCVTLTFLGYLNYKKTKNKLAYYIALSQFIFGIAYIIEYLEINTILDVSAAIMRLIAYLVIIFALQAGLTNNFEQD